MTAPAHPASTSRKSRTEHLLSSIIGPARHEVWRLITATAAEFVELARRHAELDAEGNLPVTDKPERTGAPLRETKWRRLDGPDLAALERPGTSASNDRETLEPLRRGAHRRLERLALDLRALDGASALGEASWLRIEQILRIHFDERILERLPNYLRPSWTRLHRESNIGGVDFYRYLDDDLLDRRQPSLVFEVYCYCFRHDFAGRYANDPPTITRYLSELEARVDFTVPDTVAAAQEPARVRRPWPVRRYYLVALASALFVLLVSMWWSNRPPERGPDDGKVRRSDERDEQVKPKPGPLCTELGLIMVGSVGR